LGDENKNPEQIARDAIDALNTTGLRDCQITRHH
jgi:hypothetical protein